MTIENFHGALNQLNFFNLLFYCEKRPTFKLIYWKKLSREKINRLICFRNALKR